MRRRGYARWFGGDGRTLESDTATCSHCQRIVHMHDPKTGKALSGVLVHCHGCDQHICVPCAEQPRCVPLEKKLEQIEARGRLLAAAGV